MTTEISFITSHFISSRAEMEKAPFLCGLRGMEVVRVTTVTVMVTLIVSTLSPLAVLLSKAFLPGMQRSALQLWPQRTAAGTILTKEL